MSSLTDSLGRLFDPKKFKNAKDKLGRWINARSGRKPISKKTLPTPRMSKTDTPPATPEASAAPASEPSFMMPDSTPPAASSTPEPTAAAAKNAAPNFADIEQAAAACAPTDIESEVETAQLHIAKGTTPTSETIIGILQTLLVLIGEEEGILTESEKLLLRPSLLRVLKKYQVGDDALPCEIDLLVGVGSLVVVRLKKPKFATTVAKIRAWVINLWFRRKGAEIQRVVTRENPA